MKIHALLKEEMVISELISQEREAVLEEMVNFLKGKEKIEKDRELYEKLIQREKLGSTAIGDGIAIPHCKLKEVEDPLLILAISRKGVHFDSIDGKPTHIFFLVISSPENPSVNLQILAAIAHLVRKAGSLTKKILQAKSSRRIIEIIREEEEKLNE
ncbi:MAG: PTS sugar transporter subunit IIA [Clostridiales bacterium]|nr:PTS sugar transporter subunit IIA [Clostridiales bacterium]